MAKGISLLFHYTQIDYIYADKSMHDSSKNTHLSVFGFGQILLITE